MKFFHLADLHFGKKLGNLSLIKDQHYIIEQILELADQQHPDAVLISGDVYDRSSPSAESVQLLDEFLTLWAQRNIPVLLIAGNHDCPERLDYAARLLREQNIYLSGTFRGKMEEVILNDSYGPVCFRMLPFVRPVQVRSFFPDAEIGDYDNALRCVLEAQPLPENCRCVLLAHQFVVSGKDRPITSESEQISVGGLDHVQASAFAGYDYVALGHIHSPQQIGTEKLRYAGTPLKYSFSEALQQKSVCCVTMDKDGSTETELLPLTPLHDLRRLKGPIEQLISPENYLQGDRNDYVYVTLTDEEDLMEPMETLRRVYPNILGMDYDNSRSRGAEQYTVEEELPEKTPAEHFADFYRLQQNVELDENKQAIVARILEKVQAEKL